MAIIMRMLAVRTLT